jgi:hypothetical protein
MANDNLYVVKRTLFNPRDPAEQSFHVTVPETDFFSVYDVNNGRDGWRHGDGVVVYAEGQGGEVLTVAIDTIPNTHGLRAGRSGRVEQLHYHILQTVIE